MRNIKRFISFILVFTLVFTSVAYAHADAEQDIVETESERIVTFSSKGLEIKTTYNKADNTLHQIVIQDGEIINDIFIDIEEEVKKYEESQSLSINPLDESAGRKMMSYQYTILNYEYEEWWYPNFQDGKGTFWYLRTFSNDYRWAYEDEDQPLSYRRAIQMFVNAVDDINTLEIICGISAIATVVILLSSGLAGAALKEAIKNAFVSMEISGATGV